MIRHDHRVGSEPYGAPGIVGMEYAFPQEMARPGMPYTLKEVPSLRRRWELSYEKSGDLLGVAFGLA
jgi:hypothetical protein